MSAQFLIGIFVPSESLTDLLNRLLSQTSFIVSWSQSASDFTNWVISNRHRIDCLIVQSSQAASDALQGLKQRDILLPTLMVDHTEESAKSIMKNGSLPRLPAFAYHEAVTSLDCTDLNGVDEAIHQAVDRYLKLPTEVKINESKSLEGSADKRLFLLSLQQQRLSEKLRERLGYVGVYYKRNQQNFLRNMSISERREFLDKLRQDYRQIILNYFSNDNAINQKIDDFVNVAFFADMSVPKIVEIHMELIDDFSKQLQLEGRNEDVLTDYRLTLIDVIAHLCEMYRRSLSQD
ncbi:MAG: circadian clock protein KaiA [Phormidesmis sp.]